ncbi:uncharacterized protein [Procambarus clarkii]|uniref:uncharacterized protein isoform X5 n=1 Tax=Procambarus clarkii TaxID=6728 RepID=UPI003744570E
MTVALERIDPQQWHPSESQVVKRNDKQKSQVRSHLLKKCHNYQHQGDSHHPEDLVQVPELKSKHKLLAVEILRVYLFKFIPQSHRKKLQQEKALHHTLRDHLIMFLNKTHKLCHMSSVHNFRYKTDGLRTKYENTLKKKLQDESYARGVPSSQHSLSYNALKLLTVLASTAFSLNLPQPSTTLFAKVQEVYPSPLLTVKLSTTACFTLKPGAVDAVRIYITSLLPGLSEEQDKTVTVYSSWMIRTPRIQSTDIPGVEWFPIMLYTGRELIHHAVVEWLQGSFGCYITKYGMYQSTLMWVAGVWSGGQPCPIASHHSNKDQEVHFTYYIRPPSGMIQFSSPNSRGKPKLVLKNTLKDIQHIWQSIVGSSHDEMSIGELRQFFLCMNNIASELSSVPSSYLYLHQLYTPCIMLNGDGKVRLTCGRSASVLLNHLINIFIQTTNCYAIEDRLRVQDGSYINDDSDTGQETHEG